MIAGGSQADRRQTEWIAGGSQAHVAAFLAIRLVPFEGGP